MRGVRYVIHCAGDVHIGWRNLERQRHVNVTGTAVIAEATRSAGARLIHVSTVDTLPASADGTPVSGISWRAAGERLNKIESELLR